MFQRLENRLGKIEATQQKDLRTDVTDDKVSKMETEIQKQKDELKELHLKNQQMVCVNKLQNKSIEDLTKRIEKLEVFNAKKTVSISGLHVYSKYKDEIGMEIQDFFQSQLGVNVRIDDTYFVGQNDPPVCVVTFGTLQDKREVMSKKSLLKDIINKDQNPIFINEFWSAEANEAKKVQKELVATNEKYPEEQRYAVDYQGPNLLFDGAPWHTQKKVRTPSPSDLIDIDLAHLQHILQLSIIKGQTISENGSHFTGYTITPTSFQHIQDAYTRIKLIHPDADHVVCAFYVSNVEGELFAQDYCDDGEHGGGRHLLNYLLENKLKQRAIFVVRYFGGTKLNAHRFICLRQAAISAIAQEPMNSVLNVTQKAESDDPIDIYNPPGSPQSKQKRVRHVKHSNAPRRPAGTDWRVGNHSRGNARINGGANRHQQPNRRGRTYRPNPTYGRGQGRGSQNPRGRYDAHTTQRKSRYSDFFHNQHDSERDSERQYEQWSGSNNGAFDIDY